MAFLNNLEQKVRINLSRAAADVVEGDMARFGTENRTGFLNTVMKQYFQTAEASIVLTLEREREHWQQYAAFFPDRESMERLMNRLLGERREALLEKAGSYPRGDSFVFRLYNENYAYMTAEEFQSVLRASSMCLTALSIRLLCLELTRMMPLEISTSLAKSI